MKITYELENIIENITTLTPSEIIKKLDEFLYITNSFDEKYGGNFHTMYCGLKIYTYLQLSSKYKFEHNVNDLEFPVFFGKWVNGDQTISLYLSPDKCKENECIIMNNE
jgi:hypothetical protein